MLLSCTLNNLQRIEGTLLEIALAVHATDTVGFFTKTSVVGDDISGLDFAREKTAGKRVVDDDIDFVLAAERNKLRFNGAG